LAFCVSITRTGHSTHITPATRGYARRQPEDTVLYGVVQDHLATLLDTGRDRSEHGFGYPRFVEREFENSLPDLSRGRHSRRRAQPTMRASR
jgi:hypothetical protein